MGTEELQAFRRECEAKGIRFVREDDQGIGVRIGVILARSIVDEKGIAIGDGRVDDDTSKLLVMVLDAIASGQIPRS